MTPAELGAGREPAPERPGATVVAPRDRGARCLPRGASPRPAAGLRGKRVPGGSFRRRRACTPPPGRARQVVPRCSFILTLREPSTAAGASWSPGERGCDRDLRLQQNNNNKKTSGLFVAPWSGARLPGPLPAELALGDLAASVVGAPRALVPTLLHRRSARGGRTHSRLQWDIFTLPAKDRKITPGAGIQPRGSFRCPSWANLPGCPQRTTFPTE